MGRWVDRFFSEKSEEIREYLKIYSHIYSKIHEKIRLCLCLKNVVMAAARNVPSTFRKLVVSKLSTNFREAVEVVNSPALEPSAKELLIRNR